MGRRARSFLLSLPPLLLSLLPCAPHARRDDASGIAASQPGRTLFHELEAGAFPGSGRPDAAVHVPPGFDARRPAGLVVYFHGWSGCVQAALSDTAVPCSEGGEARPASHLASQLDDARVNALLVAVELRADLPTGETGQLATVGGLRALLREVLEVHVGPELEPAATLPVDAFEPVVLVGHSGGYQAVATALALGELPHVTEVVLLDGLYGADPVFDAWVGDAVEHLDATQRFVDLYTCCGGTLERSRALAGRARALSGPSSQEIFDDDGDFELDRSTLTRPVVFKRVPRAHGALPEAYLRPVLEAADLPRLR